MKQSLIIGLVAALESEGACPEVKAFQNLNADRFEGIWYPLYSDEAKTQAGKPLECLRAKTILSGEQFSSRAEKRNGVKVDSK